MLALTFAAAAAAAPLQRAQAAEALSRCRAITEATARLACFDDVAARLEDEQAKGAVVIIDRKQVKEISRQAFGLNVPSLRSIAHLAAGDADSQITLRVAGAQENAEEHWVVATDEGQQWRQTDSEVLGTPPSVGSSLSVRRAALGSFFCKIDRNLAFRCVRDH